MLTFRPARPEDEAQVVPLMYASSPDLVEYSFGFPGQDPRAFLALDFRRGSGVFGWRNQLVAEDAEGRIAGTLTAYRGRRVGAVSFATVRSAWRHFGIGRFLAVLARSLALAPLFIRPRPEAVFLANVFVVAEHRGGGVSGKLFDAAARIAGAEALELDVSFTNPAGQRAFERLGFAVVGERPYRGKRGLPGFRRMAKSLANAERLP